MKQIQKFETFDGEQHRSIERACKHLDRLQGNILCRMANELIRLDGKYTATVLYLSANTDKFKQLVAIEADMTLENPDE